jgi:type IV secretory pathway protease TraF
LRSLTFFEREVGDRIVAAGLDTLERLIEATYDRDRAKPLTAANLAIEKLRHLFRLAFTLKCIDERRYEHAARAIDAIGRQIGAWTKAHRGHEVVGMRFPVKGRRDRILPMETLAKPLTRDVRGAIVTVQAVDVAPGYAAERNFTDPGDRFLKRVVGASGDVVCGSGAQVTLNDAPVAERHERDSAGRALPTWPCCVPLDQGHVFLLGETPDSFDGRYWGPTPIDRIEGVWRPIRLP